MQTENNEERRRTMDRRLTTIEYKIDKLASVIEKIAVQGSQIQQLQQDVSDVKDEVNRLDNSLLATRLYQASCPRKQITFLWVIVVPMGLTMLAIAVQLLRGVNGN